MRRALLVIAALLLPPCGHAESPEAEYARIIAAYAGRGALDEPAMTERVRPIAARLVAEIASERPETATWRWEVHVTSDPSVSAFCMAGGKVLVGSAFVRRLALDEAELAMLLAHEMAHAFSGHRRPKLSPASPDADPAAQTRESQVALMQEDQADRLGLELAHRAGWAAASLAGFFDKLAAGEPAGNFSTSHASPVARAASAHEIARRLDEPRDENARRR